MARKLLLIRHSQSLPNPQMPASQWRLSPEGIERCSSFAAKLAPWQPTRVVSSLEAKAIQTGQLLGETLDLPAIVAPNLHEHSRTSVPWFDDRTTFQAAVQQLLLNPDERVFGEETANEALLRFSWALWDTIPQFPADTLAIVTHGTVLTLFVHQHNDIDPVAYWQALTMPACAVLEFPDLRLVETILYP